MAVADPLRRQAGSGIARNQGGAEAEGGIEHRDIDMGALPGLLPRQQRGKHAPGGEQPADGVGDRFAQ
ncbi:hypothetical protein D3C72_2384240 [compost metagenome]